MSERTKSTLIALISPIITVIVLIIGWAVASSKTEIFTSINSEDVKGIKTKVSQHDVAIESHSMRISAIELKQPETTSSIKDIQTAISEMKVSNAQFQGEMSTDIKYIKEALIELKQNK